MKKSSFVSDNFIKSFLSLYKVLPGHTLLIPPGYRSFPADGENAVASFEYKPLKKSSVRLPDGYKVHCLSGKQ